MTQSPTTTVLYGDAWDLAQGLVPQSIDCIVTSPPYWGLRDYGHPDQFGLEATPQEYVTKLVGLFARLRPALKDCGTVWLNLGDSYANTGGMTGGTKSKENGKRADRMFNGGYRPLTEGLKPKDLVGIPWRVAFALQDDGWWLRSDIIWSKPNPMPESVTDRPTKSHEHIFLLAKSERYYSDQDAVREPSAPNTTPRPNRCDASAVDAGVYGRVGCNSIRFNGYSVLTGRNVRTVWSIPTKPYAAAHFATFSPEIPERCIKAGSSERGVCPVCGKHWERVVEHADDGTRISGNSRAMAMGHSAHGPTAMMRAGEPRTATTTGWQPTCDHDDEPIPGTVLDPFAGSGTTLEVARKLGRNSVGFELNEDYRVLIEDRLKQGVLC